MSTFCIQELLDNGHVVKVGKNQIHRQETNNVTLYVVERHEGEHDGEDKFSVVDGYYHVKNAVKVASSI